MAREALERFLFTVRYCKLFPAVGYCHSAKVLSSGYDKLTEMSELKKEK